MKHGRQDRRYARRHRRPILANHAAQRFRLQVAARHQHVAPRHPCRVGNAPRIGVEHGNNHQAPIVHGQPHRPRRAHRHRVQINRPVAVHHSLGIARSPGRVAHRGRRSFVEHWPLHLGLFGSQQFLVAQILLRHSRRLSDHDHLLHRAKIFRNPHQQGHHWRIHENDPIPAVVDDERQLFRKQAQVQRVDHRPHARHRVVGLEMLLRVPAESTHPVPLPDAQPRQGARQPLDTHPDLAKFRALQPVAGPGRDLALAVYLDPVFKNRSDRQGKIRHRRQHATTSLVLKLANSISPAQRDSTNAAGPDQKQPLPCPILSPYRGPRRQVFVAEVVGRKGGKPQRPNQVLKRIATVTSRPKALKTKTLPTFRIGRCSRPVAR